MMTLEKKLPAFREIQKKAPVLTAEERQSKAHEHYLQAVDIMQRAEAEAFAHKESLMQAYRHLAVACNRNPQEARYPTTMAYLLLLINCEQRANNYLGKALQIDPQFQAALDLQQAFQRLIKADPVQDFKAHCEALKNWPRPESEADFDRLYDQTELTLHRGLQFLMHRQVVAQLSMDKATIASQKKLYAQICRFEALIQGKLKLLAEDLDVLELERTLKPVLQLKNRYQNILMALTQIQELESEMQEASQICERLRAQISEQAPEFVQRQLEIVYDFCDLYADRLDALAEQHEIMALITRYEALVSQIEKLQDDLDGI